MATEDFFPLKNQAFVLVTRLSFYCRQVAKIFAKNKFTGHTKDKSVKKLNEIHAFNYSSCITIRVFWNKFK